MQEYIKSRQHFKLVFVNGPVISVTYLLHPFITLQRHHTYSFLLPFTNTPYIAIHILVVHYSVL